MENIEQEVIDLPTQVGGHRPSAEKKQKGFFHSFVFTTNK